MSSAAVELRPASGRGGPTRAKSYVLTDADMLKLLGRDRMAMQVLLFVRMRARGKLKVDLIDDTIAEGVGCHRLTVLKVRRRLNEAGIRVVSRRSRHGHFISSRWDLDRRHVALFRGEYEQRCSPGATTIREPKASTARTSSEAAVEVPAAAARAGPDPPVAPVAPGDGELEQDPVGVSVPIVPPEDGLEPELGELRAIVAVLRRRAGRLDQAGCSELAAGGVERLRARGGLAVWRLLLARLVVVAELQAECVDESREVPP